MRCLCCVRGGGCAIHRAGGVLGYVSTHLSYMHIMQAGRIALLHMGRLPIPFSSLC